MSPDDDLLIQRCIAGELSASERAALAARLRSDAQFRAEAVDDIQTANLIGSALRAPPPAVVAQSVHRALALTRPEQRQVLFRTVLGKLRPPQRRRWLAAASGIAAALCGLVISWWVWQSASSREVEGPALVVRSELIEAADERRVTFADGSFLDLGAGSRVLIEHGSDGVLCRLERGRLRAEVTPQHAGRAVRVSTTHALIEVVGTRFSVALAGTTHVEVEHGLVRVAQADGQRCHVAAGFRLESSGSGPVIPRGTPRGTGAMSTAAPRLGCTWPSGHDPLADELFTLRATKQRHWISMDVPRSTVSWRWSDDFYAQAEARQATTLQNAFFWSDIIRPVDMDPPDARRAVDEWIGAFLARYRSRLDLWEVVDEPLTSTPAYAALIGGAGTTGWDWLIWLHQRARQQAPDTALLLGGFEDLASAELVGRFVTVAGLLHERGLLDGLVIKAHELQHLDPLVLKANLDRLARVGVPLYLCEVDIAVAGDQAHAEAVARIFPVLWEHPAVRAVVFWGLRQGSSFHAHDHLVTSAGAERPAVAWLRSYLAEDVLRLEVPATTGLSTIPLIIRPGYAGHAVTRVEVAQAGQVLASATVLPALLDLPLTAASGGDLVVRAFAGDRQVAEVRRSWTTVVASPP